MLTSRTCARPILQNPKPKWLANSAIDHVDSNHDTIKPHSLPPIHNDQVMNRAADQQTLKIRKVIS